MSDTIEEQEVPQIPKLDSAEVLQNRLSALVGPVINQFIDDGEALLIAVVVVAADGGRRSTLYMPRPQPDMDANALQSVEEARSVGQFQAAIQFGKLHSALSETTTQTLRAAARQK